MVLRSKSYSNGNEIVILLATYNGSRFLPEQISSYKEQSVSGWSLYIRDDASSDSTQSLLNELKLTIDGVLFIEGKERVGSNRNFSILASRAFEAGSKYFFFSDQDDIWHKNKVEIQSSIMEEAEGLNASSPILVFSDMSVIDSDGNTIAPSFMEYQKIKYEENEPLRTLLAQNFVTGCASMLNRELVSVALPFPKEAVVHDWWVALCAAAMGYIKYIPMPLVKYRQHENNQIGAKHWLGYMSPLKGGFRQQWLKGRDTLRASMLQARALAERVKLYCPNNPNLPLIDAYADLVNVKSAFERLSQARSLGIRVQTPWRRGVFVSRLLLLN